MSTLQIGHLPMRKSVIEVLARIGYGARGLVYTLVGGLAILAALGTGGATTSSRGALRLVLEQPLGWAWLCLIGAGLAFFVLWRLAQAVLDADGLGTSWKMLGRRAGYLIGAVSYTGLSIFAVSLALGLASKSEAGTVKAWAEWFINQPFGSWLVVAAGIGIATGGLSFLWHAWCGERVVKFLDCPAGTRRWAVPLGRFGFAATGLVFALIGGFLIVAGYYGRSGEARDMGGVLDIIEAQPFGWALLGVTAMGFMAFGLFGFVQARYRRIEPKD